MLFAQSGIEDFINVGSNVTAMALLATIVVAVVRMLPKWLTKHEAARDKDREERRHEMNTLCERFYTDSKFERDQCAGQFRETLNLHRSLSESTTQALNAITEQMRVHSKALDDHQKFAEKSIETIKAMQK